jgi:hypothetical protein
MLDTLQSATLPEKATPPEKAMPPEERDYYKWAAGIALPVVLALIPLLKHSDEAKAGSFSYSNDVTVIENQYQQITGHPLTDEKTKAQLTAAMNLAKAGRYNASLQILESLADAVPVPAVFTSIGSFYANKGNKQAAQQFFDKAVAKDPAYEPALRNLTALATEKPSAVNVSRGREVEPNNDLLHPNVLPIGVAVNAEISERGDTDFFKFKTGGAPRDIYRISLKNQSTTLAARFSFYDSKKGAIDLGSFGISGTAGADVDYTFSPAENSEYYVQISGDSGTTGSYTLTVEPKHAFDRFEPNDEPRYAKSIALGEVVDANIMDGLDIDVYQVKSSGAGKLSIVVKNTSRALQPQLNLYDSNRGSIDLGSWGVYATAGADLTYTYERATPNTVYYVQISGASHSAGSYSLTVR